MQRRQFMTTAAAVCGVLAAPQWASAQTAKGPLRIIVPYTAGGSIDVSVRRIAERLEPVLGTILVENRPGAGGGIGMNAIARAPADGLTVGIAAVATNAINPWLFKNLPYDAEKDFAPITQMTRIPNLLVMNAEVAKREGIETFDDFMAYAKRNSGKLSYGSGGNGSAGHLAGEIFKRETGLDIVHVPYNGARPPSWHCCHSRWTSRLTTSPVPQPISARASSSHWQSPHWNAASCCLSCHLWPM